jgi:hypothetical protein
VAPGGRLPGPGLASGSRLRRGWQRHFGWRGSLGLALLFLAAAVWWFKGLPATPHSSPRPTAREAAEQRFPQGGARQRTEDLSRLLALAQAHGVDVPLARYEVADGPVAASDAPTAAASSAPSSSSVRLQVSLIGPTQGVEAMLRESQRLLPHASTEHLGLETVPTAGATAASGLASAPFEGSIRAQWRLLLRYRSGP